MEWQKRESDGELVEFITTQELLKNAFLKELDMGKNNPAWNIPIRTPILWRIKNMINKAFAELTSEELKELEREIDAVTDYNCSWKIRAIAEMYADKDRLVREHE